MKVILFRFLIVILIIPSINASSRELTTIVPIEKIVAEIKNKTDIPIYLPEKIESEMKLYFISKAHKKLYYVTIAYLPDCSGDACSFGEMTAEKTNKWRIDITKTKIVTLVNGIQGYFGNACGASCSSWVEWEIKGIHYKIATKGEKEETVISIANSTILGGVRTSSLIRNKLQHHSPEFESLKSLKIDTTETQKLFENVKKNYSNDKYGTPVYGQNFKVYIENKEFIFFSTENIPPINSGDITQCDINILLKSEPLQDPISRPCDEIKAIYFFKDNINSAIWFVTIIETFVTDASRNSKFTNTYAYIYSGKDFIADESLNQYLEEKKVKNIPEFKKYFLLYFKEIKNN